MNATEAIDSLLTDHDIYLYIGEISALGHERLIDLIERNSQRKDSVYLIPVTNGGEPDAGFRIARALGQYYPDDIKCFIPDICKSAGTLITIGCKELIISDRGELGPLDMQLKNKEELFENSSGLDIMQAINSIQESANTLFLQNLFDLRSSGLGTRMAAQIASRMATDLVAPISGQIDPNRLGEHQRSLKVAAAYGSRLNEKFNNTDEKKINYLITGYPSHSFVIDRKEARKIFTNVRTPTTEEQHIEERLRKRIPGVRNFASSKDVIISDLREDKKDFLQDLSQKIVGNSVKDTNNKEKDEHVKKT